MQVCLLDDSFFVTKIALAALINSFTFCDGLSLGCCGILFIKEILAFNSILLLLSLSRRYCGITLVSKISSTASFNLLFHSFTSSASLSCGC